MTKNLWLHSNGLPTVHEALAQVKALDAQGDLFPDWDNDPIDDQWERVIGTCLTCEETAVEIATGVMGNAGSECWKCYGARMNDIPNSYDRVAPI